MKLYIASDLHIEFEDFIPDCGDADVVILAGDIGVGPDTLDWVHQHFDDRPVIYVLGNHEYYRHNLASLAEFRRRAAANVHVLDRDAVEIGGVRFLGATLWTDYQLHGLAERYFAMEYAEKNMTDYRLIRYRRRRFSPLDAVAAHEMAVRWLTEQLATPFDGKTVVVTHHAPSAQSVAERFRGDALSPAFASRLEHLMDGPAPALWVHGHTHDCFDYCVHGTRVFCNPRGYPGEGQRASFDATCAVEL